MFDEKIKLTQWIGLILLFIAVFIMCSYNNSIKEKLKFSSFIVLVICGVSNGITDLSQKIFVEATNGQVPAAVFNFYIYVFAAIILFVLYIASFAINNKKKESADIKHILGYIFIMSICLFLTSYFKTKAASWLPATQIYPLCQGGGLILSSVMSVIFFKERLTLKGIIGIVLAFVALIVINVL